MNVALFEDDVAYGVYLTPERAEQRAVELNLTHPKFVYTEQEITDGQ